MSLLGMKVSKVCWTERDPTGFLMRHVSNNPRKQEVSEIRGNRMGTNLTVPLPMRDFAKLKILECSAIGQQMNWIEPCVPTTFENLVS